MAATGNGNSNLILHLDKIAYGICGAAALVVLLIPLFSGKEAQNLEAGIQANMAAVKARERDRPPPPIVPTIRKDLEDQWKVPDPGQPYPGWTTERIPSVIKWTKKPPEEFVVHKPARLERIEYHRHSERLLPYLRVIGKFGELTHGEFRDVKLLRRKGEQGDFIELRDFGSPQALLAQAIEFDDFDVEPGAVYAYRIHTEVAEAPDAAENVRLETSEIFKDSEPCGITQPVPHDFAIYIIDAKGFDAARQRAGQFYGDITIANYANESGAPEKLISSPFEEGFEFGPVRDGRKIFRVLQCEDTGVVTIRDLRNLSVKHVLKRGDLRRPVELPPRVDCGAPPPPPPAGEPGAEPPPAPAGGQPEAGGEPPPEPPPPGTPPPEGKKEEPKNDGGKDKDKDKDKGKGTEKGKEKEKEKPKGRFK